MLPGVEELESKVRAASEAADPTAMLLAEHEWMRFLIEEYRQAVRRGERIDEVHQAVLELEPLLDLHIRREEEAYFPAVEAFMRQSGQGSTFDMYGEHDAIRIRLGELIGAFTRGLQPSDAYAAFARSLLVHFDNEEDLIFSEAPDHLSEEDRLEILRRFEALT